MNVITKYLSAKNDVAFKHIFGVEKNKDILIAMLNAVLKNQLHKPIKEVQFLSPIQLPELNDKKATVVDVLCKDRDGCQYIIEMQVGGMRGFEVRAQYYASKAFVTQAKRGGSYQGLREVIFLAFCDFHIFPKKRHYKSEHVTLDKTTNEHDLVMLSFTFVDLLLFDEIRTKEVKDLTLEEKFYYFLCHAEEISDAELALLVGKDKVIKKAFDELNRFGWSNEEVRAYEAIEKERMDRNAELLYATDKGEEKGIKKGKKEGMEEGIKQGKKEGIKQGKKEGMKQGEKKERNRAISSMLLRGFSKQEAASTLKLSLTQVEEALK